MVSKIKWLGLFFGFTAFAQLRTNDSQQFLNASPTRNYIRNSGAEKNVANVTLGGSMAVTRTTTTPIEGSAEFTVDGAATNDTADFTAETFQLGLSGQNCVASFTYEGDASLYTARARIGTSNVASLALSNVASGTQRVNINFPCGDGSSAMVLRIENTGAAGAAFRMDSLYVGLATNLTQVAQAQWIGSLLWPVTANCLWSGTTTGAFTSFSADTDCGTATVAGSASQPATKIPGVTFASLPPGEYLVIFTANMAKIGADGNLRSFRIFDGTTGSNEQAGINGSVALMQAHQIAARFSYTTAQSNITFQLQYYTNNASGVSIENGLTGYQTNFNVYRYPTSTELAVRSDLAAWKVDATIAGSSNPQLGTVDVTSFTELAAASLGLTNNPGTQNIPAQILCSATNPPTGTTCSAGNESVGVAFTPTGSFPQDVLACVSFASSITTGAGGEWGVGFQVIETPTNAQTISQEGKSRVFAANQIASSTITTPFRVCGLFTFSSAGQRALRLMYEQDVTGTVSNGGIFSDQATTAGQRDIHWEVYPLNQAQPAPILVNSVTASGAGPFRVEFARVGGAATPATACTSTPCTIHSQSGGVSSVTRGGTGDYIVNFVSNTFSARPSCTMSASNGVNVMSPAIIPSSATVAPVNAFDITGALRDVYFDLICMGPR